MRVTLTVVMSLVYGSVATPWQSARIVLDKEDRTTQPKLKVKFTCTTDMSASRVGSAEGMDVDEAVRNGLGQRSHLGWSPTSLHRLR